MTRRVLVTGAAGFVGRHVLTPLLERGFEVHALAHDISKVDDTSPVVSWHETDLLDERATEAVVRGVGATHLLHLAWYTEHGKFFNAPENVDWVAASLRLVRSFRAGGGQRAVVAGTCAEYDWTRDCCERAELQPASLYGISKNALRQVLEGYGAASGMSTAWGRVFFTFGPGEHPARVIPAVARALLGGDRIECSDGTQVRDFLYVADVAEAFAVLVDSTAAGAFDIGSGRAIALRDMLTRLERLAGRCELVCFGQPRGEPPRLVANPHRLRDELGWGPVHALDDGLRETLAWWRELRRVERQP